MREQIIYLITTMAVFGIAGALIDIKILWKNHRSEPAITIAVTQVAGALLYLRFGVTAGLFIGTALFLILLYASLSDCMSMEVSDYIPILIAVMAVATMTPENVVTRLLGAFIVAVPLLISILVSTQHVIGGADIKLSCALGLLLGLERGLAGLVIGILLALICRGVVCTVNKESRQKAFALVPYLSIGAMAAFLV